jgi:hypothetical protein
MFAEQKFLITPAERCRSSKFGEKCQRQLRAEVTSRGHVRCPQLFYSYTTVRSAIEMTVISVWFAYPQRRNTQPTINASDLSLYSTEDRMNKSD